LGKAKSERCGGEDEDECGSFPDDFALDVVDPECVGVGDIGSEDDAREGCGDARADGFGGESVDEELGLRCGRIEMIRLSRSLDIGLGVGGARFDAQQRFRFGPEAS
jgi:hypothetical protein